ncbi:ISL3 family transposase [Sinomonas sp. ASV486]|uniref:ISL3 family transposase n=1 Tax=Sinomonas sp. ASV486 TaxID=3051170 RepID=UPI0027DEA337|nr:ISL3 family transposase [Sinomonas sp. ASV486]MDQ4490833.1 ISL3 family transposase [Sinomonas sp. ASV486]
MDHCTCGPGARWCARADALFHFPGLHVLGVCADDSGGGFSLTVTVETDADVGGCPGCGCVAVGHGRRVHTVADTPCFGTPVRIRWLKRIWRCPEPACPKKTFSEAHPFAAPRAKLSVRAVSWATDALERDDTSVSALARHLGVDWGTVWDPVAAETRRRLADPGRLAGIDALGVDEHLWSHTDPPGSGMVTGIVDHTRGPDGKPRARLLDLVPGRSGPVYRDWLKDRGDAFRKGVEVAALDPFQGYKNAIDDQLEDAVAVLDAFHVVKLGTAAVDEVRRCVQQATLGHRRHKGDPLYGIQRTLRCGAERLTEKQNGRLATAFDAHSGHFEVELAWACAQQLRSVYTATDPAAGRWTAEHVIAAFPSCPIPEIARLGKTLRRWRAAFLAYFDTKGSSNGPTEAVNGVIETTRRIARGFRNFENYRLRCLLSAGGHRPWRTPNHA